MIPYEVARGIPALGTCKDLSPPSASADIRMRAESGNE